VRDITHVRLIDAHAEGDGRDHHDPVFALKPVLRRAARGRIHAGVVGNGRDALGREP
jgi:hypothetical protein